MKRREFLGTVAAGMAVVAVPVVGSEAPTLSAIVDAIDKGIDVAHLRLSHRGKQWDSRAGYYRHAMTGMLMYAMQQGIDGLSISLPSWASGKSIPNGRHLATIRQKDHEVELLVECEFQNGWPTKRPRLLVGCPSDRYDEVQEALKRGA